MSIDTNVNTVESFVGSRIQINDATRTNIAPSNANRIRIDVSLDCDIETHCIELFDASMGGNLIGVLDREFSAIPAVIIRDRSVYTMDKNTIHRGDIWAIITDGTTPYDIIVTEYIG